MNIYVYSDESGVFDSIHNDYYIFGGLILIGEQQRSKCTNMYAHAEKTIRTNSNYSTDQELKANFLSNKEKYKLYRSLNSFVRFGAIIDEKRVIKNVFQHKKDRQRYLDYAYKLAVKNALQQMMTLSMFKSSDIENIHFFVDEHTTATNGIYELRESIEQEFKRGTYNYNYYKFFPPIFPDMGSISLDYCNSAKKHLVRAADIVANHLYHAAISGNTGHLEYDRNLFIKYLP